MEFSEYLKDNINGFQDIVIPKKSETNKWLELDVSTSNGIKK